MLAARAVLGALAGGRGVSHRITKVCMYVTGISPPQKAVLMCLADHADDGGSCWPAVPRIAMWTCLGRTAVLDAQKALEQAGIVSVARRFGRANGFCINVQAVKERWPAPVRDTDYYQSAGRTATSPPGGPPPAAAPVRRTDPTSPRGDSPPVRRTDVTSPPGGPESPRTAITEPPVNRQRGSARATRRCPHDFELTPRLREWALTEAPGVDLDRELAKFKDHTFKDSKSDWPATFRNWIRTAGAPRSRNPLPNRAEQRQQTIAGLTGRSTHAASDDRTIDGDARIVD